MFATTLTSPIPTDDEPDRKTSCVFLDRDGTLIVERHYLGDPDQVQLESGVVEGLKVLADAGLSFIVVSNQSGIERGLLTLEQVEAVNRRTSALLAAEGICILQWYVCPHSPSAHCECRKPRPGLIERAMSDHHVEPGRAAVFGDKDVDLIAARTLRLPGYLVSTGHGLEHVDWARREGFSVSRSLAEAADTHVRHLNQGA